MLFFGISLFAQSGNITGKVYDENGIPLPGANIVLEGTTYYGMSDLDGSFKLINVKGFV